MLKKSLGLFVGLLVSLVVFAATPQLQPDHPDTYVVQKGDTLWDISAKFLKKPWLWPEIWRANPQVHNPHLIYPGDVLKLAYLGGNGDNGAGTPYLKLVPKVRKSSVDPTPPIPLEAIKPFLENMRVVDADRIKSAPYVMAFEAHHLRGIVGRLAYVRGLDAQPGQKFALVRPTHAIRAFDADEPDDMDITAHTLRSNVAMVESPWKEITRGDGHWGKGDSLGVEVRVIGEAQVLRSGDPASLMISSSERAIQQGDRLLPIDDSPYDSTYYPHPGTDVPAEARVIALTDALRYSGRNQVIALSVGRDDGVRNGATFTILRPGQTVQDNVASDYNSGVFGESVQLPPEYIGHVLVFRTFEHTSYGLVMSAIRPVMLDDLIRAPQ